MTMPKEIWAWPHDYKPGRTQGEWFIREPGDIPKAEYILKSEYDSLKDKLEIARWALRTANIRLGDGLPVAAETVIEEALAQIGEG